MILLYFDFRKRFTKNQYRGNGLKDGEEGGFDSMQFKR